MKKILVVVLGLSCSLFAVAQTRVVGRITDAEDKSPVAFATVAIYNVKDTALIDGAITGNNGSFTISKVPKGQFILRISFVGYITSYKDIEITDDKKPLDLGNMELAKGVELKEFEVKDFLIPIQIKDDTVEFNAEAFKPIEGSMLEELLKKLPGVEVEKDGTIKVNGKVITQVLVEGEKFFTDDPKMATQNIPADFVQKIQTFEKKSDDAIFTGINDGKEEQVINIKLKPEVMKGNWFGRLVAGGGVDTHNKLFRYNNHATMNYFKGSDRLTIIGNFNNISKSGTETNFADDGSVSYAHDGYSENGITKLVSPGLNFVKKFNPKWSISGAYTYHNNDQNYEEDQHQERFMLAGSQYYNANMSLQYIRNSHNFNTELKYTPSANDEIIICPTISVKSNTQKSFSNYELKDTLTMINQGTRQYSGNNSRPDIRLQATYGHRFAKPQRTIRFNLSGNYDTHEGEGYNYSQRHFAVLPSDTLDQYSKISNNNRSWTASAIYTEPLIRDFILSLSYDISSNESNGKKLTYNYNSLTESYSEKDSMYSNNYGNTNFSQDFDVSVQKAVDKYNYSFGVSLIPSKSLNYMEGQADVSQNVLNFEPHAQLFYSFSKQSRLNFNYRGMTRQPHRFELQALPDKSNPLSIFIGNPDLKPEFRHNFTTSYNNLFKNQASIYMDLGVEITQNKITNVQIYTSSLFPHIEFDSSAFLPGVNISMPDNVDLEHQTWSYLSFSTPLFSKKIRLHLSTSGEFNTQKNLIDKDINILKNLSLSGNVRIIYTIDRFDISLNSRIRKNDSKFSLQSDRDITYYNGSAGVDFSWQIIKDKLILSSKLNYTTSSGYADGYERKFTRWDAQIVWNFGKANIWQLRFQINDILNDTKDSWRYASENYITDFIYKNTLRRYVMLSLTYNIKRMNTPPKEQPAADAGL